MLGVSWSLQTDSFIGDRWPLSEHWEGSQLLKCELTLCLFFPYGRYCCVDVAGARTINLQIRRRSQRAGEGQVTERTFLQGMDRGVAHLKGLGS